MGIRREPRSRSSARIARVAAKPSITGIWQSMRTMSKRARKDVGHGLPAVEGQRDIQPHEAQEILCQRGVQLVVLHQQDATAQLLDVPLASLHEATGF